MLVLGMGFLSKKAAQLRATKQSLNAYKAKALAWAGLEDIRVKLNKDPTFPPGLGRQQNYFAYTERMHNSAGEEIGTYSVEVDLRYENHPYRVLVVTSTGRVGTGAISARRTIRAEFDIAPDLVAGVRDDDQDPSTYTNPNYWRFYNYQDLGGF